MIGTKRKTPRRPTRQKGPKPRNGFRRTIWCAFRRGCRNQRHGKMGARELRVIATKEESLG